MVELRLSAAEELRRPRHGVTRGRGFLIWARVRWGGQEWGGKDGKQGSLLSWFVAVLGVWEGCGWFEDEEGGRCGRLFFGSRSTTRRQQGRRPVRGRSSSRFGENLDIA